MALYPSSRKVPTNIPNCKHKPPSTPAYFLFYNDAD